MKLPNWVKCSSKGVAVINKRRDRFDFDPKALDPVKRELCLVLRRIALQNGWTQREYAWYLRTSPSRVTDVVRFDLDKLTVSQLFNYLAKARPDFRILISI